MEWVNSTQTGENALLPQPDRVRVILDGGTITLNFILTDISGKKTPSNFIIVLAQYDSNRKNTGNNKFFLSNEYAMTSDILLTETTYQTNVCTLIDGVPQCQYKFLNNDIYDSSGNIYYYKLGVSAIYKDENYNTPMSIPYNITSKDKFFTLNQSLELQNNQYKDFLAYQNELAKKSTNIYNSTISSADGQYELIKSQLGNYPDNLVIDDQTINENTLNELVDKTMAQGIINLNVKI